MSKHQIMITIRGENYYNREMNNPDGPKSYVRVDILGAIRETRPIFCGCITMQKIVTVVNACCAEYYNAPDEKYSTHAIMRCLEKGYFYIKDI